VWLFMVSSALMPLFAVTGWMLYLDRRRRKRAAREAAAGLVPIAPSAAGDGPVAPVLVVHASQTGTAERLAWQTARTLLAGGVPAEVVPMATLDAARLASTPRVLFVAATFGEGQPPDAARRTARWLAAAEPGALSGVGYAVLALGDREYGGSFCGFGRELDRVLHHAGARPLFDRVDVDATDPGDLRHWQHHVAQLGGAPAQADWEAPRYDAWRLASRRVANAGSPGAPVHHIRLVPDDPSSMCWTAGDVAEIGPRHAPATVDAYLEKAGLEGTARVAVDGAATTLAERLASSLLPPVAEISGLAAQAVSDALRPLPHREYTIASLPPGGSVDLLVREMRGPDGTPGLGSGWLALHSAVGARIALRIRNNPSFHPPPDARPVILVGNGTGIAGLRAILAARAAGGHRRNWLLFGERSAAHDLHFEGDLRTWQAEGFLPRMDLAFSREQQAPGGGRRYVQHLVDAAADDIRDWIGDGAAIYVCGSLEGMAPAVDAALARVLGVDVLEDLAAEGRYRRDVY
jgi:sulfite reductase (NADPH) flavoprotein alpha-component